MKKLSSCWVRHLLASTAMMGVAKAADELTITSWGGAYSESQRKAFYEPYHRRWQQDHRSRIQRRNRQGSRHGGSRCRDLGRG